MAAADRRGVDIVGRSRPQLPDVPARAPVHRDLARIGSKLGCRQPAQEHACLETPEHAVAFAGLVGTSLDEDLVVTTLALPSSTLDFTLTALMPSTMAGPRRGSFSKRAARASDKIMAP